MSTCQLTVGMFELRTFLSGTSKNSGNICYFSVNLCSHQKFKINVTWGLLGRHLGRLYENLGYLGRPWVLFRASLGASLGAICNIKHFCLKKIPYYHSKNKFLSSLISINWLKLMKCLA